MKYCWYAFFCVIALFGTIGIVRSVHRQARLCTPHMATQIAGIELTSLDERWIEKTPYFFLGKGRQCQVFESFDGTYVVKVSSVHVSKKSQLACLGGILALERAPEETGVCAVGLGKKNTYLRVLSQKGKMQTISLCNRFIVIQHKASSFKRSIVESVARGDIVQAKRYVRALFEVMRQLRGKHLLDQDGALIRNGNLGKLGDRIILMDTGRLCVFTDYHRHTLHDMHRLKPLRSWLYSVHLDLVTCFDECQREYARQ